MVQSGTYFVNRCVLDTHSWGIQCRVLPGSYNVNAFYPANGEAKNSSAFFIKVQIFFIFTLKWTPLELLVQLIEEQKGLV